MKTAHGPRLAISTALSKLNVFSLKVIGIHIHCKNGNICETIEFGEIVATDH